MTISVLAVSDSAAELAAAAMRSPMAVAARRASARAASRAAAAAASRAAAAAAARRAAWATSRAMEARPPKMGRAGRIHLPRNSPMW